MKKLIPVILALLAIQLYSNNECEKKSLLPIINEANRINICSDYDFFASASFIYWKGNMDYNILTDVNNVWSGITERKSERFNTKYQGGLKVGLGYGFDKTNWETFLEYTKFHTHLHKEISTSGYFLAYWHITTGTYTKIIADWTLDYNMFDLILNKSFFTGKYFTLKPTIGLRGGYINYKYYVNQSLHDINNQIYVILCSSNSQMIGPHSAIDLNWNLIKNFRIMTNFNASLLYQNFTKFKYSIINKNWADSQKNITPNFGSSLGLGWGGYFENKRFHFDLSAIWELNYYYNQNIIHKLIASDYNNGRLGAVDNPNVGNSTNGDLWLYGFTFTGRFDF